MSAHRYVPVSKDLDDTSDATTWRCLGCGVEVSAPDSGECPASSHREEGET